MWKERSFSREEEAIQDNNGARQFVQTFDMGMESYYRSQSENGNDFTERGGLNIVPFAAILPDSSGDRRRSQGSTTMKGERTMRFVMFMIPKVYQPETPASEQAGDGFTPPADAVEKMTKYNEKLAKAGLLVSLDGFHPIARGARVAFNGSKPKITDGPSIRPKEVVGGFWMINAKSKEEAVEWARRVPAEEGDIIEIRQVFEMSDFPPDVRQAADNPTVKSQVGKHNRK